MWWYTEKGPLEVITRWGHEGGTIMVAVKVNLDWQLDWIVKPLEISKAHLRVCLWGLFRRQLDPEGSDLMNGLISDGFRHWADCQEMVELWKVGPIGGSESLDHVFGGYTLPWPPPVTTPSASCLLWVEQFCPTTLFLQRWKEATETVSYDKSFLPLICFSLVFGHSDTKLMTFLPL
jgi:hypothetical protein